MQHRSGEVAVADLAELLPPLAEEIGNRALARDVKLRIVTSQGALRATLDPELATRILKRLIGAAVDAAPDGQLVEVDVRDSRRQMLVSITRPLSTRHLTDAQLFDPSFQADGEDGRSKLGLGFALRLVRGLARLARGDLRFTTAELRLSLPSAKK